MKYKYLKIGIISFAIYLILLIFSMTYNIASYFLMLIVIYLVVAPKNGEKFIVFVISLFFIVLITLDLIGINKQRDFIHTNLIYSCTSLKNKDYNQLNKLVIVFGSREILTNQISNCPIENNNTFLIDNIIYYQYLDLNGWINGSDNNYLAIKSYNYLNKNDSLKYNTEDISVFYKKNKEEKDKLIKEILEQ